eukprot:gene8017-8876_t
MAEMENEDCSDSKSEIGSITSRMTQSSFGERNSLASSICGREIFEPRERFTLFKVNVNNGERRWVVYRRFSDFVLLNKKLKKLFPRFQLNLPPKRFFKDNFNKDFIQKRQVGLEEFMRHLFSLRHVMDTAPVKQFFRLDNPPGPYEDLGASRNYCRSLEESVSSLKIDLKEQDYELSYLRSELARMQFNNGSQMAYKSQNESCFAENVLQKKLVAAEETAKRATQEVERLKVEIQAQRALELSTRNEERQKRDMLLRDNLRCFNSKQQEEDDKLKEMVASFGALGQLRIDLGGRSIDVRTAEGVPEKEIEVRNALTESRKALDELYKGHLEYYKTEIEDLKTDLVKTEYQLQTASTEIQNMKDALAEVHANRYEEMIKRDGVIYEYQKQLEEAQRYTSNAEQKYFYSLILGVKLNMALWGKATVEINQLKPAILFAKVRDQGISIEHWPSWISRELATLADLV